MSRPIESVQLSTSFDYDSLAPTHRFIVQEHTGEIRKRLRRSAQDVCEIGQRLADVRERLKYGQFLAWLKMEFGWSQRTAYNFINVYEVFGDRFEAFTKIDIATSVLYQLAAPSVPEELRTQVLKSAVSGKKITQKSFKSAIQKYTKHGTEDSQKSSGRPSASAKPEVITLIPQSIEVVGASVDKTTPAISVTPGWYCLDTKHFLFCGDTASSVFVEAAPQAKLAVAVTTQDWAHDWLVDQVGSVVILNEEELTPQTLEQLLNLLSSPGEIVLFPWLPLPEMIAIAHSLGRRVWAGDNSPERCQLAIAASGLNPERISQAETELYQSALPE